MTINYTYGVITGGMVPSSSPWYRGTYNVMPTTAQRRLIGDLTKGYTADAIGQIADTMVHIIQCSPVYPVYINDFDPINTYTTELRIGVDDITHTMNFYDRLLAWSSKIPVTTSNYVVSKPTDDMQVIVNSIFSVLTTK